MIARSKKLPQLVQHQSLKLHLGVKLHWEEAQLFKEVVLLELRLKEAEKIDVKDIIPLDEALNYNTDVLDSLKKTMDSLFLVSV